MLIQSMPAWHTNLIVIKMLNIFLSKVNILNVNCARAKTFIIDSRTDVLVKLWKI